MLIRVAIAAAVAVTAALASAPSAHAETTLVFISVQPDSSALVGAFSDRPATSLQVLRGSTPVAQAANEPELPGIFGGLSVGHLELGDRVVVSENGALVR